MFHDSLAATLDMAVLPGVLGCSFGRLRTSSPCDVPFRYASEPIPRYRGTVTRWHAHLHCLATAIHKTSGLGDDFLLNWLARDANIAYSEVFPHDIYGGGLKLPAIGLRIE